MKMKKKSALNKTPMFIYLFIYYDGKQEGER